MNKIFYNGTIITMEDELYAESVLIKDGIIEKVGSFPELLEMAPDAEQIDLLGATLIPAFIDAHGHFSSYATAKLQVHLDGSKTFAEIAERITDFTTSNNTLPNAWITASGYDHNMLEEKSHPSKKMLDLICPNNPLILQHQSGHCGVLNSKALELLGIAATTPAPMGGVIGKKDGQLNGYMEEDAYIQCIKRVPMADFSALLKVYEKAQEEYFSYGITTAQDGMLTKEMMPIYKGLLAVMSLKLISWDIQTLNPWTYLEKTFLTL